jgi:hypothetical protein
MVPSDLEPTNKILPMGDEWTMTTIKLTRNEIMEQLTAHF